MFPWPGEWSPTEPTWPPWGQCAKGEKWKCGSLQQQATRKWESFDRTWIMVPPFTPTWIVPYPYLDHAPPTPNPPRYMCGVLNRSVLCRSSATPPPTAWLVPCSSSWRVTASGLGGMALEMTWPDRWVDREERRGMQGGQRMSSAVEGIAMGEPGSPRSGSG